MNPLPRLLTAICVGVLLCGASAPPVRAQSIVDRIKKAAEDAKKKAEEETKKKGGDPQPTPSGTTPAQPNGKGPATPATPAKKADAAAPAAAGNLPKSSAKVEELVLVSGAGQQQQQLQFVVSPKGGHAAAVVLRGSRMVVVRDGVDGPRFDAIIGDTGSLAFSPDGAHLAYVGRQGTEFVYMLDDKELLRIPSANHPQVTYTGQTGTYPHFTANSRHVYFDLYIQPNPTITNGFHRLVFDGVQGPDSYSEVAPVFDAAGEHHAYMVQNPQKRDVYSLVVDGKPSAFGGGDPQWTADGLHLITKRSVPGPQGGVMDVLVDGKPVMRAVQPVIFTTPVGSGFVAVASQGNPGSGTQFITVAAQRIAGTDCPWSPGYSGVTFSADGKHWAAVCQATPTSRWVVVDGKKGQEYQNIAGLGFLPDGRLAYAANMRNQMFMVVGDQESNGYTSLIGPDADQMGNRHDFFAGVVSTAPGVLVGSHVGYVGANNVGGVNTVVVDGKSIQRPVAGALGFSPDGSRFAFTFGQQANARSVNVDGMDLPGAVKDFQRPRMPGPLRGQFVFSPDSKHIAYFGAQPNGTYGIFVDGKFTAMPGIAFPMNPTFTSDSRHLIWMDRPGGSAQVLYVDGRPAAQMESNQNLLSIEGTWELGSDGTLTVIGQVGDALKRFQITPGPDTSVDLLTK